MNQISHEFFMKYIFGSIISGEISMNFLHTPMLKICINAQNIYFLDPKHLKEVNSKAFILRFEIRK